MHVYFISKQHELVGPLQCQDTLNRIKSIPLNAELLKNEANYAVKDVSASERRLVNAVIEISKQDNFEKLCRKGRPKLNLASKIFREVRKFRKSQGCHSRKKRSRALTQVSANSASQMPNSYQQPKVQKNQDCLSRISSYGNLNVVLEDLAVMKSIRETVQSMDTLVKNSDSARGVMAVSTFAASAHLDGSVSMRALARSIGGSESGQMRRVIENAVSNRVFINNGSPEGSWTEYNHKTGGIVMSQDDKLLAAEFIMNHRSKLVLMMKFRFVFKMLYLSLADPLHSLPKRVIPFLSNVEIVALATKNHFHQSH